MTILYRAVSWIAGLFGLAVAPETVTLFSAPLNNATGRKFACHVVNISSRTRDVTIEIISCSPKITLAGPTTLSLSPGMGDSVVHTSQAIAYGKATFDGSKTDFRMAFTVEEEAGSGDFLTIASTPLE